MHHGALVLILALVSLLTLVPALDEELLGLLLLLFCGHQIEFALEVLTSGPVGLLWMLTVIVACLEKLRLVLDYLYTISSTFDPSSSQIFLISGFCVSST